MTPQRVPAILVADDNKEHREALGKVLACAGYQVAAADSGYEALQILRAQAFDLVFADLYMPQLSGLDLLRNIRSMGPEVPVVIITAFGDWVTYADAVEAGAVDYLNKPVRREDLLLTARRVLGRWGIRTPNRPNSPGEGTQDAA